MLELVIHSGKDQCFELYSKYLYDKIIDPNRGKQKSHRARRLYCPEGGQSMPTDTARRGQIEAGFGLEHHSNSDKIRTTGKCHICYQSAAILISLIVSSCVWKAAEFNQSHQKPAGYRALHSF